jgi:hypothetical protein
MQTLFLVPTTWDLCADASGNIAVASAPWQLAQDVASAARLFLGELWYNTTVGGPYFNQILGQQPSIAFIAGELQAAALSVPGVYSAQVVIVGITKRQVTGQIQFTDINGATLSADF